MKKPLLRSFFSYWENEPQNLAFMRNWAKRIPCVWQPGKVMDRLDELNDIEIEAAVRDYLYRLLYWTGNQDPRMQYPDSPVDLLRFQDEHWRDNDENGPSWECGPFSALYVGLLAAVSDENIPARRLYACRSKDGQADYGAEVWSQTLRRWYVVVPHLNLHFESAHGRLGAPMFIAHQHAKIGMTPVAISGQGQPAHVTDPINLNRWQEMDFMAIRRGNKPHAGGGPLKPEHWQHLPVLAPIGNVPLPDNYVEHGTFDPRSITAPP